MPIGRSVWSHYLLSTVFYKLEEGFWLLLRGFEASDTSCNTNEYIGRRYNGSEENTTNVTGVLTGSFLSLSPWATSIPYNISHSTTMLSYNPMYFLDGAMRPAWSDDSEIGRWSHRSQARYDGNSNDNEIDGVHLTLMNLSVSSKNNTSQLLFLAQATTWFRAALFPPPAGPSFDRR